MKIIRYLILGVLILTRSSIVQAQGHADPAPQPIDETILHGILGNGFTYYIKPLETIQPTIQMTFFVKVGSFYESEKEGNFAHTLEHLAFKDTENFPEGLNSNSKILSSLNMHHRNLTGRTSTTFTKYMFEAPKGNEEAVRTGLLWFRDIATGLNISEESIASERGVTLQEYRGGDANRNQLNAEKILEGNLFPCRIPDLNFTEHNRNFPYQDIQQFYKKWYRPDRMAVSITGNVADLEKLEEWIKEIFSTIPEVEEDLEVPACLSAYFERQPQFSLVERKPDSLGYNPPIQFNLIFRDSLGMGHLRDLEGVKGEIAGQLIVNVLNHRLRETVEGNAKPFELSGVYQSKSFPNSIRVYVTADENTESEALREVLLVISQLKFYQVTPAELERAKKVVISKWAPAQQTRVAYWVQQIEDHFVHNEALPDNKRAEIENWISGLSPTDLQKSIMKIVDDGMPEDIGIMVSENITSAFGSEKAMRTFIKNCLQSKPEPYMPVVYRSVLLTEVEKAALDIEPEVAIEEGVGGSKKLLLKNGLTVVVKNMPSSSHGRQKIYLHGFSLRGASCFPPKDYYSAMFAPIVIKNSGIGKLSKYDLDRFYDSISFNSQLRPYVQLNEAGIKAEVSRDNLEELLQLVYLYFSQPRKDETAFENWKSSFDAQGNPSNELLDLLNEITKDYIHLPYSSKRISGKKEIRFEKVHEIYKSLFSDARNFTFILSGNFDETIIPLLQKYLGNLPSSSLCSSEKNFQDLPPKGPVFLNEKTLEAFHTENIHYGFKYIRSRGTNDNWKEEIKTELLGSVLNRMFFDLRGREGFGLYSFGGGGQFNRERNRYEIQLSFNCTPEEFPMISKRMREILEDLKNARISEEVFLEGKNTLFFKFDKDRLSEPRGITEALYKHYRYGEAMVDALEVEEYFKSLAISDIAATAQALFMEEHLYEVLMTSENRREL